MDKQQKTNRRKSGFTNKSLVFEIHDLETIFLICELHDADTIE